MPSESRYQKSVRTLLRTFPVEDALKIRSYIMINIGAFMTKNSEAGLTIAQATQDKRFWICHPAGTIEEGTAVNQ